MSCGVVVDVVVDDRQHIRVVSLLSAAHIRHHISGTRERRLENTCGGGRGVDVLCIDVIVVDDSECSRRRWRRSVGFLVFPILNFIQVINGTRIASAGHSVLSDGGQNHALTQTLLEATILAAIPLLFCDHTLAVGDTSVHSFVLHGAFEESLTALTRDDAVVQTCGSVLTNHANHLLRV